MEAEETKASAREEQWKQQLQYPDWYLKLEDYLRTKIFPVEHDNPELRAERNKFYAVVEKMLKAGQIPLAESGPNLDAERQPIDTVIIHHTEEDPSITLDRLSAIGFVRQYGQKYLDNDVYGYKGLKGQPIWSGHFRDGKMVFFAYHWLIRPNGTAERLLEDKYVGRHALDMNLRSVGIAFSGNYEHSTPPIEQIAGTTQTIKNYYSFVESGRIFGHREVMQGRTCPGDKFLDGWKNTLIDLLKKPKL